MRRKDAGATEDALLVTLLEFQHGAASLDTLKKSTLKVPWAKGFPESQEAFWNCEAFLWGRKIEHSKRDLIRKEMLRHCSLDSDILDIGSGSYCYLPSIAFDCSVKMLQMNDTVVQKILGDLTKKWSFEDDSFDFVTAIFVLNYLEDLEFIFSEVKRVLRNSGKFVVVLSATGVSELHQMHEKQQHCFTSWKNLFHAAFSSVELYEKEGLWFFVCNKQ